MAANTPHVQVRFFTKSSYSVPSTPFSVPADVGTKELSSLINSVLHAGSGETTNVDFDFLIDGEFLRITLSKHLDAKGQSTEEIIETEYVERHPAPKPEDTLLHNDWVSCIQGGKEWILSGCYDNTIHIWTMAGKEMMTIPGHTAPVKAVEWINIDNGPISSFLTGSHDQTILLWSWNREKNEVDCINSCRGHAGSVDCLAVNFPKTLFCSGSWDRMLKLWSAELTSAGDVDDDEDENAERPKKKKKTGGKSRQTRVPMLTLEGHSEGISGIEWLDDSTICTVSWDHTIRLWDMNNAKQKALLQSSKVFLDVSYSELNQQIVTASADRHIRMWDPRVSEGAIVKCTYTSHNGWVSSVAWSKENEYHFISGSYDNYMKMWDTRSPKVPLYNMTGHEEKILAVDWSIPSLMLSGGADGHLKVYQYNATS
ncbi:ribosome biogenesis protein wdr12-like [Mizuhopecten yessoensis]|uniref:Ribosome biogenesis protein WDR12 homolog n=1 Tax=Mizuhopecten yessoensis TaxID=6573 RepID=A0A210PW14_MIZYE|nr:ribosome biogenesis protein wdr12-like [Mizuhopecten yessoensis]OWF40688.1 Ribosome biogenesis protein WDR12-like [Mizuhopecten yessoensis]